MLGGIADLIGGAINLFSASGGNNEGGLFDGIGAFFGSLFGDNAVGDITGSSLSGIGSDAGSGGSSGSSGLTSIFSDWGPKDYFKGGLGGLMAAMMIKEAIDPSEEKGIDPIEDFDRSTIPPWNISRA